MITCITGTLTTAATRNPCGGQGQRQGSLYVWDGLWSTTCSLQQEDDRCRSPSTREVSQSHTFIGARELA